MTVKDILERENIRILAYDKGSRTYLLGEGGVAIYITERVDGMYKIADRAETYRGTQDFFAGSGPKAHRTAWHKAIGSVNGVMESLSHCVVKDNIEDKDLPSAIRSYVDTVCMIKTNMQQLAKRTPAVSQQENQLQTKTVYDWDPHSDFEL